MQITSMQRLHLLNKMSQLQILIAAYQKILSDRDKPLQQDQVTLILTTISNTLDIVLNPP